MTIRKIISLSLLFIFFTISVKAQNEDPDLWYAHDGDPDWSPDGQSIVFVSWRDRNDTDLWIMDADGKNPRKITSSLRGSYEAYPEWSPNGDWIAFTSVHDRQEDLYTISLADRKMFNLFSEAEHYATHPVWSADGGQIAFSVQNGEDYIPIYRTGYMGGLTRVSQDTFAYGPPQWSPDGQYISAGPRPFNYFNHFSVWDNYKMAGAWSFNNLSVFEHVWTLDGNYIIYTLPAPGEHQHEFWKQEARGSQPQKLGNQTFNRTLNLKLFPDGSKLIFESVCPTGVAIWTMNIDGTDPKNITDCENRWNRNPDVSPDGQKVVFQSMFGSSEYDIWVMNVDGTEAVNLTENAHERIPAQNAVSPISPD